jgi:hypothetical protein
MPLNPGDKRISVTYNPVNAYITPDVPLRKESDPTDQHELARIMDTLGMNSYLGVVFVGQMTHYFLDETGNNIAGYDLAPFNTLNDAYVAANSRFGTPSSGHPVAVVLLGANTVETHTVQLCSDYINIFGIAGSTVTGAAGIPIFTACHGSGMTIQSTQFISNNAPILEVPFNFPFPKGAIFEKCILSNIGTMPPVAAGLFDVHEALPVPISLNSCQVNLNNWQLLYFDPNSNPNQFLMVLKETVIEANVTASNIFQGLDYLGVRMINCALVLFNPNISLFTCYSNGGATYTEIDGLRIMDGIAGMAYPLKLINNSRYNTIEWLELDSQCKLIVNVSAFTDATFEGDFRNSTYTRFSLTNPLITLDGLRMLNCSGDTLFTVGSATSTTEFVNLRTFTPLQSINDVTALVTSAGAVSAKFFNCELSYLLHYPTPGGVFC